jgi:hypothetical protein
MNAPLRIMLVICLRRTSRNHGVRITQVTLLAQDILPRSAGGERGGCKPILATFYAPDTALR